MELRLLRYFLAVAREGNITRAAEDLHITQPTLSRQLAQLEEELGCTLFRRGGRKLELTQEGMLLRRRAEEMLQLEERIQRELTGTARELSGVVTIGSGSPPRPGFCLTLSRPSTGSTPWCGTSWSPATPTRLWSRWTWASSTWHCLWSRWTWRSTSTSPCPRRTTGGC